MVSVAIIPNRAASKIIAKKRNFIAGVISDICQHCTYSENHDKLVFQLEFGGRLECVKMCVGSNSMIDISTVPTLFWNLF